MGLAPAARRAIGDRVPGRLARPARCVLMSASLGAIAALVSVPAQVPGAPPASATSLLGGSPMPSVSITSPSPGGTQIFTTSSPVISGTAVPSDPVGKITTVKVVITSSVGAPGATFELSPQAPTTGTTWSFSGTPVAPIAYNGSYSVAVTVTETDTTLLTGVTTGTGSTSGTFAEAVAPVAPEGVTADLTGAHQVTVSWSPNPEPDIEGYAVLRSTAGGAPAQVGFPTATSYVDTSPKAGNEYTYSVVAIRAGASPGETLLSPASSTVSVEVSGTAPPPTSTPPVSAKSGTTTSGAKSGTTKSGSTKAGSTTSGSESGSTNATSNSGSAGAQSSTPAAPLLTQSQLAAQYAADIAAAGSATAPSSSTATTSGGSAPASQTGAPSAGGYSDVLPYPKGQVPSGTQAASIPARAASSGSRARTLATVALGMIVLVLAALGIRLVLKVRRP